jgi:hypothetical protein
VEKLDELWVVDVLSIDYLVQKGNYKGRKQLETEVVFLDHAVFFVAFDDLDHFANVVFSTGVYDSDWIIVIPGNQFKLIW